MLKEETGTRLPDLSPSSDSPRESFLKRNADSIEFETFEYPATEFFQFVREHWNRLSVGLERHQTTICDERFRVSKLHPGDGTPGALMTRLREQYGFDRHWVKAEPWPFPVPFGQEPETIDVDAVAGRLGCTAFVYRDPDAGRGRPSELILIPVFP